MKNWLKRYKQFLIMAAGTWTVVVGAIALLLVIPFGYTVFITTFIIAWSPFAIAGVIWLVIAIAPLPALAAKDLKTTYLEGRKAR